MLYNLLHKFRISHIIGRNIFTERFLPFRIIYKLFQRISFSRKIKRNGKVLVIPVIRGVGFMNLISNYEKWMDELLPRILESRGGAFVDVGANIGQTMLKVLPQSWSGNYYAIEPNRYCALYLEKLIELNGFKPAKIFQYALADTEGEIELLLRFRDDILATTSPSFRKFTKYSSTLTVLKTTGDALFSRMGNEAIGAIKIDVEGGELKVLKGFLQMIKRDRPYLLLEILPLQSKDPAVAKFRSENAKDLLSMVTQLNYRLFNIKLKNQVETMEGLSQSLESSNYLALPNEASFNL